MRYDVVRYNVSDDKPLYEAIQSVQSILLLIQPERELFVVFFEPQFVYLKHRRAQRVQELKKQSQFTGVNHSRSPRCRPVEEDEAGTTPVEGVVEVEATTTATDLATAIAKMLAFQFVLRMGL